MHGPFKLDHLQLSEPILLQTIFNFFTFILGVQFLLGTIHKGRPHERGGGGYLKSRKMQTWGRGGSCQFGHPFLRCLIWHYQILDSCHILWWIHILWILWFILWFTVGLLRALIHLLAATYDLLNLLCRLPPCDCLFLSGGGGGSD